MQAVKGKAIPQYSDYFSDPRFFRQEKEAPQCFFLRRRELRAVLPSEFRRLPEQRCIDGCRTAVHIRLCFSVCPEQPEAIRNFPQPAALCGAEHVPAVLPVIIERLIQKNNLPEGRRCQGDPVVVHHRVLRHRMPPQELDQRPVHHHRAAGHIVLHQQLIQLSARRAHLLVAHIGVRLHPPCGVRNPHIAVYQQRRIGAAALLSPPHHAQGLLRLIRMPDIILIGKPHIVRSRAVIRPQLFRVFQHGHEMPRRAAGGSAPPHKGHARRKAFRVPRGDLRRVVRGAVIRNQQTDSRLCLPQN